MERLIEGYHRFRKAGWPERQRTFEQLAENGQKPKTLVLACVDSRVDPTMIFDAAPGELLVIRNVANLAPPYEPDMACHGTSAALEFGVRVLEVERIIVLGHGMCGGVAALLNGAPDNARDFVAPWMDIARPARARALEKKPEDRQQCCEHGVVKISIDNLMSFPWIADRVACGRLALHGAWFSIYSGRLRILGDDGDFHDIQSS